MLGIYVGFEILNGSSLVTKVMFDKRYLAIA